MIDLFPISYLMLIIRTNSALNGNAMLEKDRILTRAKTTLFRIGGEDKSGKAFDPVHDRVFELDEISKDIIKLIDGRNSIEDIMKALSQEYDVAQEEIESDVYNFLKEITELGIVK